MSSSRRRHDRSWRNLTPDERRAIAARDPVVIVPLAATEQHGPHLPPSTDTDICRGLLDAAFERLSPDVDVWTLDVMAVGASLEHARFPSTRSVTDQELILRIVEAGVELARAGVRRLVLFNSHGGNRHALDAAALRLRADHDLLVVKANYFRFPRPMDVSLPEAEWKHGLHGGALETAMMLHLCPDLVRRDAVADFPSIGTRLESTLRHVGPEGVAPFAWLAGDLNHRGVVGDARLATPEMGHRLVNHYATVLAEVILDSRTFPIEYLERGPESAEGAVIDGEGAWSIVLATEPPGPAATAVRVTGADRSVYVDVESGGSWRASCGVSDAARDLFDIFLPIRATRDIVIGQLGQSLDGRIATESGASHFVTGQRDIERLHRLRALVDAVVVGARTVAHDDPRLTVRLVDGASPVRVVLDPSGRLAPSSRVFTVSGDPTLVVVRAATGSGPADPSREEIVVPWSETEGFDLSVLLAQLRGRGLRRVLVEGGGLTVSRFLRAGLLDRLHLTVAPMLIGSGRPSITLDPVATLDLALRPSCRRFLLGEDVLFDLDLRRPHE